MDIEILTGPPADDDDLERRVAKLEAELARVPRYPTNIKGGYCGRCRYYYTECECFAPPRG
jgi:hypothetical protein